MATSTCPARCFTAIFNYWLSLWTQPGHLSPPVLLWTRCGHPPSPAPGEPVAWDGPYLMPEGAGWPVSPTHLQHPQLAARGCHLDPSQLSPTSSHLLLPEHPTWAAATWSLLSFHLPFAAVGCFFFCFSGSSALVSAFPGLEDKVYPRDALHIAFPAAGSSIPTSAVSHVLAGR